MKKIYAVLTIIIILTGCTGKISENNIIYNSYIEEMSENNKSTSNEIVDIDIELEKNTPDEMTYRVTIDGAKMKMGKVEAIVYHNQLTEDVYPSIGIFDKKPNLLPNLKKNTDSNAKGIVLVGYIKTKKELKDFHPTIKVMILYNDKHNERQKIYYNKTF